jgi:hypothetical protein
VRHAPCIGHVEAVVFVGEELARSAGGHRGPRVEPQTTSWPPSATSSQNRVRGGSTRSTASSVHASTSQPRRCEAACDSSATARRAALAPPSVTSTRSTSLCGTNLPPGAATNAPSPRPKLPVTSTARALGPTAVASVRATP